MKTLQLLTRSLLILLSAFCFARPASADWIDPGASYRCNAAAGEFEVLPLIETSDGVAIPLRPGFSAINFGETHIACDLGKVRVQVRIILSEASATGTCAGVASSQLWLTVDGRDYIRGELFNGGCWFDPTLYRVVVLGRRSESLSVIICKGTWGWKSNYDDGKCNSAAPL